MSVHVADVNKIIDVETNQVLTGSTVALRAVPPTSVQAVDGTYSVVVEYLGTINGTKIRHIKTVDTFNIPGVWRIQAKVNFSGGEIEYGDETSLQVYPSF